MGSQNSFDVSGKIVIKQIEQHFSVIGCSDIIFAKQIFYILSSMASMGCFVG
jgi:hypothetical protein